ncbi:MAG: hypothetical protein M3256_24660 [Actinomycetota bacterium]|nr:hypothetical protein [Actinomycetota bacterium]
MSDADGPPHDETDQFLDGPFFWRILRSELVLGATVGGLALAAFETSGFVRIALAALAVVLLGVLAWSGFVTCALLLVRVVLRPHLRPPRNRPAG